VPQEGLEVQEEAVFDVDLRASPIRQKMMSASSCTSIVSICTSVNFIIPILDMCKRWKCHLGKKVGLWGQSCRRFERG